MTKRYSTPEQLLEEINKHHVHEVDDRLIKLLQNQLNILHLTLIKWTSINIMVFEAIIKNFGLNCKIIECEYNIWRNNKVYELLLEAIATSNNFLYINLSWSNLNNSEVQRLANALKKVKIAHVVDLSRSNLSDAAIKILATPGTSHHINLSNNNLGDDAVRSLASTLETSSTYYVITLNSCQLSYDTIKILENALINSKSSHCIKLSWGDSDNAVLQSLTNALKNTKASLKIVLLDKNLNYEAIQSLVNALKDAKASHNIDLLNGCLRDVAIQSFISALSTFSTSHDINLSYNDLSDEAMKLLANVLKNSQLPHNIKLSHNNLSDEAMELLVGALETSTASHTIDLSWNGLSDATIQRLVSALISSNASHSIALLRNSIDAKNIESLANALATSTASHTIDLSRSSLGERVLQLLGSALEDARNSQTLRLFDIDDDISCIRKLLDSLIKSKHPHTICFSIFSKCLNKYDILYIVNTLAQALAQTGIDHTIILPYSTLDKMASSELLHLIQKSPIPPNIILEYPPQRVEEFLKANNMVARKNNQDFQNHANSADNEKVTYEHSLPNIPLSKEVVKFLPHLTLLPEDMLDMIRGFLFQQEILGLEYLKRLQEVIVERTGGKLTPAQANFWHFDESGNLAPNLSQKNVVTPYGFGEVASDGWCLYHSVSEALDQNGRAFSSEEVLREAIDHIRNNPDLYIEPIESLLHSFGVNYGNIYPVEYYVRHHEQGLQEGGERVWGDAIMVQALARSLGVNIRVDMYTPAGNPQTHESGELNGTEVSHYFQHDNPSEDGLTLHIANIGNLHFVPAAFQFDESPQQVEPDLPEIFPAHRASHTINLSHNHMSDTEIKNLANKLLATFSTPHAVDLSGTKLDSMAMQSLANALKLAPNLSQESVVIPNGFIDVASDGWCLYHAVSAALAPHGIELSSEEVLRGAIDHIRGSPDLYRDSITSLLHSLGVNYGDTDPVEYYANHHAQGLQEGGERIWGDSIMVQALARSQGVNIRVDMYTPAGNPQTHESGELNGTEVSHYFQHDNPSEDGLTLHIANIGNLHFVPAAFQFDEPPQQAEPDLPEILIASEEDELSQQDSSQALPDSEEDEPPQPKQTSPQISDTENTSTNSFTSFRGGSNHAQGPQEGEEDGSSQQGQDSPRISPTPEPALPQAFPTPAPDLPLTFDAHNKEVDSAYVEKVSTGVFANVMKDPQELQELSGQNSPIDPSITAAVCMMGIFFASQFDSFGFWE